MTYRQYQDIAACPRLNRLTRLITARAVSVIVALVFFSASFVTAQTGGGTIVGTVHDPSGAQVPGAVVSITNLQTATTLTTSSSSAGQYVFPVVPVGVYSVTITAQGFQQAVNTSVVVELNKIVTVDASLHVGSVTSSIKVEALSSQLETHASQNTTTIDQATYSDLPIALNGAARSATGVADLMPGVADAPGTPSPTGQVFAESINGGQAFGGEVIYDGVVNAETNVPGDYRYQAIPVEALQEFSLVQNNFSAEFGRTPGGILTYSTRSGTNRFHGEAFEFLQNNDLDAAGYFNKTTPPLHQNEFGVSVGGPVVIPHLYNGKDKLFFFAFYSGYRLSAGVKASLFTLPTLAEQAGDFSSYVDSGGNQIPVYDPLTTNCNAQGVCTRQQFSYNGQLNVIPPSRVSGGPGAEFAPYIPHLINSNLTNNFLSSGVDTASDNRYGGRIDYNVGQKDLIHVFFSTGPQTSLAAQYVYLFPFDYSGASTGNTGATIIRIGEDHTFSPRIMLHLAAGYNRDNGSGYPPGSPPAPQVTLGIGNTIGVTPGQTFEDGNNYPTSAYTNGEKQVEQAIVGNGFLSWEKGKNQFKLGAEIDKNGDNTAASLYSMVETWSYLETSLPSAPNPAATGNAFASMMVGALDFGQEYINPVEIGTRFKYFATYFQDDYKVLPSLTLNLGIRYEIPWTRTQLHGAFSSFVPTAPNPGAGGIPGALSFAGNGQYGCHCSHFADTRFIFVQPRIGFSWKFNDRMVLRGGYGIFTGVDGDVFENGERTNFSDGFNAAPSWQSVDKGVTPAFYTANGFPSFTPPPFIDPSFDNNGTVPWLPKKAGLTAVISNWTLDLQQQLPRSFLLDVAFVGNTAAHLGSHLTNVNQIEPGYMALYGNSLNALLSSQAGQATGVPLPYAGFAGTVQQALRQFPQYQNVSNLADNIGQSAYSALQVKLQRQFVNGLSVLASYTYAKLMTNSEQQAPNFYSSGAQNAFDPAAEIAAASTLPPSVLALSYVYDLPLGPNKRYLNHGVGAAVLGGWGVSGIHHYQSGTPLSPVANNTLPINSVVLRPDYVPGQAEKGSWTGKFNPYTDFYINPSGFVQPPAFAFGNVTRNIALRSPAYFDEDLSLRRTFHIYESTALQFRTDFFNSFNRVDFGGINTTSPGISPSFGQVTSQANTPRSIQFSFKLLF